MSVKFEYKGEMLIAKLSGDIDHHTAVTLREEIDNSLQNLRPSLLRLDFACVPFMDSSGIGLILGRVKMIKRWNGEVSLTNLTSDMEKMAKIAGVFSLVKNDWSEML